METNKSHKTIIKIFRVSGWLVIALSIICILISSNVLTLSQSASQTIPNVYYWSLMLLLFSYTLGHLSKKHSDPTYKTDMLPHFKSGFFTTLALVALTLASVHKTIILLSCIAIYWTIYLIITTIQQNNRL